MRQPGDGWRIVVFTTFPWFPRMIDEVARSLGHRIVGIFTTPEPGSDATSVAQDTGWARIACDVIISDPPKRWAAMLAPLRPDLIVCNGFPRKIPQNVLDLPRLGGINGHPSLLPKYRGTGTAVFSRQFLNDERETGFTVHRMDGGFDSGPILARARFPILDDDDVQALLSRHGEAAPTVFREALERLARGDGGTPQNLDKSCYAEALEDGQRIIDWSQLARNAHNQVRAWHGLGIPRGAIGRLDGSPVVVTRTRLMDAGTPAHEEPGTVRSREEGEIVVQCGDRPLRILEWQPLEEGRATSCQAASSYASGSRPA